MKGKDKLFEANNVGRTAQLILENLSPYLNDLQSNILVEMKNDYRTGRADHLGLMAHVAQLVVLENLQENLKNKIKLGQQAAKELNNGPSI
jgi:hypothetical protein